LSYPKIAWQEPTVRANIKYGIGGEGTKVLRKRSSNVAVRIICEIVILLGLDA
jgi:hypothetical protein